MNEDILKQFVHQTYQELPEDIDKQDYGSLVTIAVLLSILVSSLQLSKLCGQKRALRILRNPSARQETRIRQIVKDKLGEEVYTKYGETTVVALKRAAGKLEPEQAIQLIGALD